jgi:two-component system, cell cycle response regulator DivK
MIDLPVSGRESAIRILLIEDDEAFRQVLGEYLEHQGYSVFSLATGADVFPTLVDVSPHLILLDLKLPKVDGFTLLKQLQHSVWSHIPCLVLSAYAFQKDRQRALDLGALQYLVKPVGMQTLLHAMQEELSYLNLE